MKTCPVCERPFDVYCAACADFDHYVAEAKEPSAIPQSKPDYEAKARSKKVAKLVSELDGVLGSVLDVKSDAALIARMLKTSGVCWKEIADCAGVRVPSPVTISAIIKVYESRAVGS